MDNEQQFKDWMSQQKKNDGQPYSTNTISAYLHALKRSIARLDFADNQYISNVFLYNNLHEFEHAAKIIRAAPNYNEVERQAGNQALTQGLKKYAEFLRSKNTKTYINQGAHAMNDKKIKQYTNVLKMKKNIILQGAPGTGKTYCTAALAVHLIEGGESKYTNHAEIMKKYDEYIEQKQIQFTTFHQSMDYEDFVEGIKPCIDQNDEDTNKSFYMKLKMEFLKICVYKQEKIKMMHRIIITLKTRGKKLSMNLLKKIL